MADFKVDSSFVLYEKVLDSRGHQVAVYGMGHFRARPRRRGVGTQMIRAMESIAKQDGKAAIVAFCDDSLLDFYIRKCGWHVCGRRNGKNVIASVDLGVIEPAEEW